MDSPTETTNEVGDSSEEKIDNPQKACIYMVIPPIKEMEYSYLSDGIYSYDLKPPFTIPQMPPHSTLEIVKENLLCSACKSVQFPFGMLDLKGVNYLLYLHEMKTQQDRVFAEESWFDILSTGKPCENKPFTERKGRKLVWVENKAPLPSVITPPNTDILLKFKEQISSLGDEDILPLPLPPNQRTECVDLTVKEAKSLTCNQHFVEGVMLRFINILMGCQQETFVAYMNNVNDYAQFGRETKNKYGPNIKKFVFVMSILWEYESADLTDANVSGNHYSFCMIEVTGDEVDMQYFDTLRCKFPGAAVNHHLPSFLCGYFSDISIDKFSINCSTVEQTSPYPKQTIVDTMCGPITVFAVCLCVLLPDLFSRLAFSKKTRRGSTNLECMSHILSPTEEDTFKLLRFAIIEWLYTANIDLDNILKPHDLTVTSKSCFTDEDLLDENFSDQMEESGFEDNNQKKKSRVEIGKHPKRKYALECPDKILSILKKGYPFARLKQRSPESKPILQLHCVMRKNFQLKAKNFPLCPSDKAPEYKRTIMEINTFLKSQECLTWLEASKATEEENNDDGGDDIPDLTTVRSVTELFAKPYKTHFMKPSNLCLTLYLKGGAVIHKSIPCNDQHENDPEAQKKIQEYLESREAVHQATIKLSGDKDWYEVCDLPVGLDTKWYFDEFKFDIKKEISMKKKYVRPVYHEGDSTLKVSVAEHKKWGKTHRFDETYEFNNIDPPSTNFPVVTMHITCASKSSACKSACGTLLSQMDLGKVGMFCPSCKQQLTETNPVRCDHCQTLNSQTWMNVAGKNVCYTCYTYHKNHGCFRPENLCRKPTRQKISYHSHLRCRWRLKLVIFSGDLKCWKVFGLKNNNESHSTEAVQPNKRPSLSTRDEWDYQRLFNHATPCKMFPNDSQGASPNIALSQKQYFNRINVIKRKLLKNSIKNIDKTPINSSWRDTEKILESKLDNVLLFHREDEVNGRDYMILLSNDNLSKGLRDFGSNILCFDTRHSIMNNDFSTSLLTFADGNNRSRSAVLSICNKESKVSHCKAIQIAIANIPCDNDTCAHERQLYILNDQTGFFFLRPCAQEKSFSPMVQHDMNLSSRRAAIELGFQTSLSQFHSLETYRKHITETESMLKLFLRPLETAFKCILRSWNPQSRYHTTSRFVEFVNVVIPNELLPSVIKERFLGYLASQWFNQDWMNSFTAEVIYGTKQQDRRDLYLLLANRMTEQKFRDIGGCVLGGHAAQLMSTFVGLAINKFMSSEGNESESSRPKWKGSRTVHIQHDSTEDMKRIKSGLQIAKEHKIVVADGGWMIVSKGTDPGHNLDQSQMADDYFLATSDGALNDDVCDKLDVFLTPSSNIKAMSQQIIYTESRELLNSSRSLLLELDQTAAGIFLSAVLQSIPEHSQTRFQINQGYICNLDIGICTCYSFIKHGQPYFCKHLFACLALKEKIYQANVLLEKFKNYVPTYEFDGLPVTIPAGHDPFYIINSLLHQSHLASYAEYEDAVRNGRILSLLHDSYNPLFAKNTAGTQGKGGRPKKRKGPPPPDPYRPKGGIPAEAKETRIVRKNPASSSQDSNFQEVVLQTLDDLGIKRTKYNWANPINTNTNNDDHHFDISDFIDTFAEVNEPPPKKLKKKPKPKPIEEVPPPPPMPDYSQKAVFKPVEQVMPAPEDVMPMLCSQCATANNPFAVFYSEKDLQDHIKQCHIQPITCPLCYRMRHIVQTFASKDEYLHHYNMFHEVHQA